MAVQPIAICGMGAVTPYGNGVDALWQGVVRGDSAISVMDLFDLQGLPCVQAGIVRQEAVSLPVFERAPRALRFAAAACKEALAQAGLLNNAEALAGTALVTGSNFGDMDVGEKALIPFDLPACEATAAGQIPAAAPALALANGFRLGGVRVPLSLSCASGAAAVAVGAELIRNGVAERVLVVGFDAVSRFAWSGLCSLRTMTREKVRPFDVRRSGTIFSEGAGAVVLEDARASLARQGRPLVWLNGWATGNNGHHLTAPAPRGAGSRQVMEEALAVAGFASGRVDHINAHGTGTHANDSTEAEAIEDVFGERGRHIPVTSVKGSLGHTLGAAGAIELIVSAQTLMKGIVPPTANYAEPDPACPLNVVTAPMKGAFACVLSNSAGFGGCNAALVVTKTGAFAPSQAAQTMPEAVVITGRGIVSALGEDAGEADDAWGEGEAATFPLARFEVPGAENPPVAGEAPEADLAACGVAPKPYLDPANRLLLAACGQALAAAKGDAPRKGIAAGTAWGCTETAGRFFEDYVRKGPRFVRPFLFPHTYSNTAVSQAAMEWSLKGPHANFTTPGTASGLAFFSAVASIREGLSDLMVAGGTDALSVQRFFAAGARPGQALGEAGAAVTLESAAAAKARGTEILGSVRGVALAADAKKAISTALAQAGLAIGDIGVWYADAAALGVVEKLRGGKPCKVASKICGDTAGAAFLLQLTLALGELKKDNSPVLIVATDAYASVASVIAR